MKSNSRFDTVIFDLDGTLIDSSQSILECFAAVLANAGIQPTVPLNSSLIGPPLKKTLMNITGLPDGEQIEQLAIDFKDIYDTEGYKASRVYAGVEELLSSLAAKNTALAIATNKRRTPTLRILEHLGWERYFQLVGTLDTPVPPHINKAALIGKILENMNKTAEKSLYVGDKFEDGEAALANRMPFIAAGWGYGEWKPVSMPSGWELAMSPYKLTEHFDTITGAISSGGKHVVMEDIFTDPSCLAGRMKS